MGNKQYRRALAKNGLGEPEGAVLLRLFDKRSVAEYQVADLDGMFDDKLLLEVLCRLEYDELVRRRAVRIFLTDAGRDVAEDLLLARKWPDMPDGTAAMASDEAAIVRRTDENLRSVFG